MRAHSLDWQLRSVVSHMASQFVECGVDDGGTGKRSMAGEMTPVWNSGSIWYLSVATFVVRVWANTEPVSRPSQTYPSGGLPRRESGNVDRGGALRWGPKWAAGVL